MHSNSMEPRRPNHTDSDSHLDDEIDALESKKNAIRVQIKNYRDSIASKDVDISQYGDPLDLRVSEINNQKELLKKKLEVCEGLLSEIEQDLAAKRKQRAQKAWRDSSDGNLDLHFANRDEELQQLSNLDVIRWGYIVAPAGYGKSALLRRLDQRYTKKGWATARMTFDERLGGERASAARGSRLMTLHLLIESAGGPDIPVESSTSKALARALGAKSKRAILFFDSLDQAEESIVVWIEDVLLKELEEQRVFLNEVRAFFTRRYKDGKRPERWTNGHMATFKLSAFRHDHVRQVVAKRPPYDGMEPNQQRALAWDLMELCLGHPRCVANLLDHEGDGPELDPDYRFKNREEIQAIVQKTIETEIIDEIIKSDRLSLDAIFTVFVMRRIMPEFLDRFQEDEVLSNYLSSDLSSASDFITLFTNETRLVTRNYNGKGGIGYETDPVVRYFSTNTLMRLNPERYDYLQNRMLKFYEDNIAAERRTPGKADVLKWAILEALFHLCRLLLNSGRDRSGCLQTVKEKIEEWKEGQIPTDIFIDDFSEEIAGGIQSDYDLPLLLKQVTGERGLESIVRLLRSA